jgi:hypothetical protein
MALDSGIPMSVLLDEPAEYLDAMFEVAQRRREASEYGSDSELME